ncbi:unnamed protein product [Pelagomonas calceolata]|uniref:RING-CH-type domain-containing protein n=1 Tax=Pelagomonas calceolata TaxID=35677 RepID=A0A8J2SU10_9STRA|nr:unnamed protein product [Pelagomonas calceolata]
MAEAEPLLLRVDQAGPRYNEALQTAVAACAADTAGQTCYICLEGAADEGLVRGCSCRGGNGFVHVSCLVRAAQVAVERGGGPGWRRWDTCGLCEQEYYGDVLCALGWACWKTYVGRPETDEIRELAMMQLGNGLHATGNDEDARSVREAELSMIRRLGAPEDDLLVAQTNLACTYQELGRLEEALNAFRDVYSRRLELNGEEHVETLRAANNYANSLNKLQHFEEAKLLLCKTMPVVRRVLGESNELTLKMRWLSAEALYRDPSATLDDLREAVTTLEEIERTARRVLGGAHPLTAATEARLQLARAVLRARERAAPGDVSSVCEGVAAMMTPGDA